MAQHRRLSLKEVEDYLERLEQENYHFEREAVTDLLRTLVAVDLVLVKHDKTPLARQLRAATHKMMFTLAQ